MQQSTPYLSFRGITMTFPGVKALSDISFDCYPGQDPRADGRKWRRQIDRCWKILSGNYIPTAGHLQIGGCADGIRQYHGGAECRRGNHLP